MDKKTVSGASGKLNPCLRCRWEPAHCSRRESRKHCRPHGSCSPSSTHQRRVSEGEDQHGGNLCVVLLAFLTLTKPLEDCWEGHSSHISMRAGHASGIAKHKTKPICYDIMKGYSVIETREIRVLPKQES